MVVIMVSFVGILLEHENMVNIQMVHVWLRDVFPLFVILMGVFTMLMLSGRMLGLGVVHLVNPMPYIMVPTSL